MSTTERQSRPRRWVWIVSGITVVVVILAAVGVYSLTRPQEEPRTQPTTETATPSTAPDGVDACLAGQNVNSQTLIEAQSSAPRTPEGAVSYAAAFARYALQIPTPTDADAVATSNGLGSEWWARWSDSASAWTGPNPISVTTVNGSYRVDSFTPDEATISMILPWVIDGAISPSRTFEPSITLERAVAGSWTVTAMDASAQQSNGATTPFTGGC